MKLTEPAFLIFIVGFSSTVFAAKQTSLCPRKFLKSNKLVYLLNTEEACYRFEPERQTGFWDANEQCESDGGTLVSVTSRRENYLLVKRLGQLRLTSKFWIGLYRQKGSFKWVDKSEVSLTHWQNDRGLKGRRKVCAVLDGSQGGRWSDDIPCDCEPDKCPGFICKYVEKKKKTKPAETNTTPAIEATTTEPLEATTTKSLEATTTKSLEATTTKSLEATSTKSIEATTTESLEATTTTESLEATTTKSLEATTTKSIEATTTKSIEATTPESIEATTTKSIEVVTTETTVAATTQSLGTTTPKCEFNCELDCGMRGFKSANGCTLCECN